MDSPPPPPQPSDRYRNWLDLPFDVTPSILRRLNVVEILTSAQMVCLHWCKVCKDASMWRTVNMGHFGDSWRYGLYDLRKICRRAVDLSCGQLVRIEVGCFCDNNLLKYITERCGPQLSPFEITHIEKVEWDDLFKESNLLAVAIAENMPGLLSLLLNGNRLTDDGVQAILEGCPRLQSLQIQHCRCQGYVTLILGLIYCP
ncbi:hypothetical protein F2P56_009263 [Juglans regia]|uniref:F-box/LRR-repeat protein 9 n=2 Tax=Juglans regia TaxID=51240 RepID=A0A2I4E773_JUGRE|nr:putative F-box/LRR-repeat protein 9 [Juglans regia]KAF5472552.1 hypothetical protein F2P56_009263 [Juglans regia]